MAKSVFCIIPSRAQAEAIVAELQEVGFSRDDISALFPDTTTSRDFAHTAATKAPEGTALGAGTGGILGGALGWLAGIGTLAIPGLGPFIAAGPIMALLGGAAVGATAGGLTGALVGYGIPEHEAKRYEGKLAEGNILLSVHTEKNDEVRIAEEIFERHAATDISSTGESSTPSAHRRSA